MGGTTPRRQRLYPAIEDILAGEIPPSLEGRQALEQILARCQETVRAAATSTLRVDECEGRLEGAGCYDGPFAEIIRLRRASVCQIWYENRDGKRSIGTGALVNPSSLILTAGHVVPRELADEQGQLFVRFGFEQECDGSIRALAEFPVEAVPEHFDGQLDYAVLRAGADESGRLPGDTFPAMPLGDPSSLAARDPLLCLQHPMGRSKEVSVGRFVSIQNAYVAYDNLTDSQSSGAPVFTADGLLVAVHVKPADEGGCVRVGTAIDRIQRVSRLLSAPTRET